MRELLVELRILGPVELRADGRGRPIGSPRLRGVLACLALNVGQPVSIDVLIDRLWTGDQPERSTIHTYIARLRTALRCVADEVRIDRRDHGYVLQTDPDLIDYHRFSRLRVQASALADSGQLDQAAVLMREAAELWTGRALENLRGDWAERTRRHLEEERLAANIARIKLELRLGHTAGLVSELTRLVDEMPLHEELIELLMRALHGCGQSARALEEYRRARRRFVDEVGTEPGRGLRELQRRILAGDSDEPAGEGDGAPPPPPRRPNNLQRTPADFVGRQAEIEGLVAAFEDPAPGTPGVVSINGMPGVGKSTLANRLAHRLTASYPDAQLHLDLGAYGAHDPLDPPAALARLLHQLGVPKNEMPATLDDRADLWRTHLADRRALLLLDDATGHDQVRHLLPGSSPSLVIITSRRRLTGLDGARPLSLAPLPEEDGASLLRAIVAPDQVDDEDAVQRVVHRCGGLPLAIRLAATRLRARSTRTVRDLAAQLDNTADLLGEFQDDDRSVRITFELSYRGLRPPQQQAFRRLSLHPGDEFTVHAAAAVLGEPIEATVRLIDRLLDDHLLEEHSRGRYRFHDLLRGYARERTEAEDDAAARTACRDRLGEYFLATAERADDLLRPHHRRERIGVRPIVQSPPPMPDAEEARRRMEMEISGIVAYAQYEYLRLPELAHAAASYLETTARWNEAIDIHWRAIKGWRAAEDPVGEAAAMVDLAFVELRCGRREEAEDLAREALATYRVAGHMHGEADALDRLGLMSWHRADYVQALEHFSGSAKLRQTIGDEKGEADALAHSGLALFNLGRYDTSILMFERALATYRRIDDTRGQVETLNNLGEVQLRLGRPDDAFHNYMQSMNLNDVMESPQSKAIYLGNFGRCHLTRGEFDRALACQREALSIHRTIGDRFGMADVLDNIGLVYQATIRENEALAHHQDALRIAREISEPVLECRTLRHMGAIHTKTGKCRLSLPQLESALKLARRIGDPYELGLTLTELGNSLLRTSRSTEARACFSEAARILGPLGVTESEGPLPSS